MAMIEIGPGLAAMTRLITELLDVSRIESGRIEVHRELVNIPELARRVIAGRVAAGSPLLILEETGETLRLFRRQVGHGDLFALRVTGDSMTGAAIIDGDLAVIRRQPTVENGEIAAAVLWLCDAGSSFLTGQAIAVDGGWTAR